jgi:hypothetical protein
MKLLATGLLLLFASFGVLGSFQTGNELLSKCQESATASGGFGPGYCLGYIVAAYDTHKTWGEWGEMKKQICTPEGATQGQLQKVVVKYLEARPEKLHHGAGSLVLNALETAFPCP